MSVVALEGNLNDSLQSILMAMRCLEPLLATNNLTGIDLQKCKYIGPYVVTYLASVYKKARSAGVRFTWTFPTEQNALRAFLSFSGLAHMAGADETPPETNHPKNNTVPLTPTNTRWQATQPIIDLVVRHLGQPTTDFEETLGLCVREIFQNIDDHAKSPVGGWYCARCLNKTRVTRVAVVDRGLGIFNTLKKNHPNIVDTMDALAKVIRGEYTAQSTGRNQGLGISNLAQQISRGHGQVILITGDAHAELQNGQWKHERHRPLNFTGTGVFFSLPIEIP